MALSMYGLYFSDSSFLDDLRECFKFLTSIAFLFLRILLTFLVFLTGLLDDSFLVDFLLTLLNSLYGFTLFFFKDWEEILEDYILCWASCFAMSLYVSASEVLFLRGWYPTVFDL